MVDGFTLIASQHATPDMMCVVRCLQLPEVYGTIRKVVPVTTTGVDGYMFVGTAKDIILEGSLQSKFRPIVQVSSYSGHRPPSSRSVVQVSSYCGHRPPSSRSVVQVSSYSGHRPPSSRSVVQVSSYSGHRPPSSRSVVQIS